eukprot:993381-Karenia_brevis.AAC.1
MMNLNVTGDDLKKSFTGPVQDLVGTHVFLHFLCVQHCLTFIALRAVGDSTSGVGLHFRVTGFDAHTMIRRNMYPDVYEQQD